MQVDGWPGPGTGYSDKVLVTDTVLDGRYRLGPMLGRGGVADVYRADDLVAGEPVAVKLLRNATTSDLRRFELEAHALERLDHPAVVRLRDQGEHDGAPYLVLDLVDGETLSSVIKRGPVPLPEVERMGACLAGALAQAHSLGIVHRDVKPGNVLVGRDRSVHVTDFGIARLIDTAAITSITETGFVIGTAAYLAPEQVRGERAGPEADVFSLGLLLLEAATGERCYDGSPTESAMARLERPPDTSGLTPRLSSLLAGMTALEPERRPSAASVADTLGRDDDRADDTAVMPLVDEPTATMIAPVLLADDALAPLPATDAAHQPLSRSRAGLLAALATVVVALALLVFALGGWSSTSQPDGTGSATTTTTVPATPVAPVTTAPTTAPPTAPPPTAPARGDKGKHAPRDGKGDG